MLARVPNFLKCCDIYNKNGEEVWKSDTNKWNTVTNKITNNHVVDLSKGDYYIMINGYGWYENNATGNYSFTLTQDLKNASITLSKNSYIYDKKAKKPTTTIKLGSVTLKQDTDYTVSYKNNIKPGTATVTIKGIGKYSGTITKTFKITK